VVRLHGELRDVEVVRVLAARLPDQDAPQHSHDALMPERRKPGAKAKRDVHGVPPLVGGPSPVLDAPEGAFAPLAACAFAPSSPVSLAGRLDDGRHLELLAATRGALRDRLRGPRSGPTSLRPGRSVLDGHT
jgi:hypothetical protein